MNLWEVGKLMHTSLVQSGSLEVELDRWPTHWKWLREALQTGFYRGGSGRIQEIYRSLCAQAAVHGIWVKRSHGAWEIYLVGRRPPGLISEVLRQHKADCVAAKLDGMPSGSYRVREAKATDSYYYANTRTLQNKPWLKSLAAKYIDDDYRRRIEPFVKRVENGRLIMRCTNGKWSVG